MPIVISRTKNSKSIQEQTNYSYFAASHQNKQLLEVPRSNQRTVLLKNPNLEVKNSEKQEEQNSSKQ